MSHPLSAFLLSVDEEEEEGGGAEVTPMSYLDAPSRSFDKLSPPAEILSSTASFPHLSFHELLF